VGYVFTRVIITAVASMVYAVVAKYLMPALRLSLGFTRNAVQRLLAFIGYGMIYRTANAFFSRIDQVLVGVWLGVAQAGIFSLPSSIVPMVVQLIASTTHLFIPLTSELQGLNQVDYLRSVYIRSSVFIAAVSTMCFVPLLILGDRFMSLWVGVSISQAVKNVFILLLVSGYLGAMATVLLVNVLIGLGRMKEFALFLLCRSLLLASFCIFLIPRLGLIGAGIAQILSSIIDLVFMFYCLPRILSIKGLDLLRVAYLKPVLLGLSIGVLILAIKPIASSWLGLILCIGLFELVYIILAFLIGIFGDTEKRALLGIWQMILNRRFISLGH
jgi:O-antigen/teichoic acid export membrane protein